MVTKTSVTYYIHVGHAATLANVTKTGSYSRLQDLLTITGLTDDYWRLQDLMMITGLADDYRTYYDYGTSRLLQDLL